MKIISSILTIIELLVLILIIFVIKNGVIRISLFVFLMPISLINVQLKNQMVHKDDYDFKLLDDKNKDKK